MNSQESKAKANLIWDKLFSIKNENKTREEQLLMIESILIEVSEEGRKLGRAQILNYIQGEINSLRS